MVGRRVQCNMVGRRVHGMVTMGIKEKKEREREREVVTSS